MFLDKLGNELAIGDTVVYINMNEGALGVGQIVAFTSKKVRISIRQHTTCRNAVDIIKVELPNAS